MAEPFVRLIKVCWLPSARRGFTTYAITIAPFVFILREMADDAAILAHEQVHLDQVNEMGWWRFYTKYIFDLNFRASVEAVGYARQREVQNGMGRG